MVYAERTSASAFERSFPTTDAVVLLVFHVESLRVIGMWKDHTKFVIRRPRCARIHPPTHEQKNGVFKVTLSRMPLVTNRILHTPTVVRVGILYFCLRSSSVYHREEACSAWQRVDTPSSSMVHGLAGAP